MNIQKALVVDDSKVAHLTLRKLLTERRIQVDWVGSGEDAIAYMEKQQPDIIFLDVMMPGMDGFETAHAITTNPSISAPPVIMCSANATEEDRDNAQRSGAIGFLSKPYTPAQMDQILAMVRELAGPAAKPVTSAMEIITPSEEPIAPVEAPVEKAHAVPEIPPVELAVARESTAGEVAKSVAEQVARDIAAQVARSMAEQVARALAEEAGRKAAQAAVQAALEAAKKVAVDIAKTTATEVARTAAEQVAREVSQDFANKVTARGLAEMREALSKALEEQVARAVQNSLGRSLASKEFKQQLQQLAAETVLPKVEAGVKAMVSDAIQKAVPPTVAPVSQRANMALVVSLIAIVAAGFALVGLFF